MQVVSERNSFTPAGSPGQLRLGDEGHLRLISLHSVRAMQDEPMAGAGWADRAESFGIYPYVSPVPAISHGELSMDHLEAATGRWVEKPPHVRLS